MKERQMYRHLRLFEDAASDVADYKKQKARFNRQSDYIKTQAYANTNKDDYKKDLGNGFSFLARVSDDYDMYVELDYNQKLVSKFNTMINDEYENSRLSLNVDFMLISGASNAAILDTGTIDQSDIVTVLKEATHLIYRLEDEDVLSFVKYFSTASKHLQQLYEVEDDILDELKSIIDTTLSAYDRLDNVKKAIRNRSDKVDKAKAKAKQSLYDEAPDYEEGGYAYWQSKKGPRRVTVVSVDEPNQRAKINTDKGATMYVPLSTLSKDEEGLYDILDED